MNQKESITGYIIAFLLVALVGVGIYWFFLRDEGDEQLNTGNNTVNENGSGDVKDDSNDDVVNNDETPPVVNEPDNTNNNSDTDFSLFTNSSQVVGSSKNKDEYILKSIVDSKEDGYHRVSFKVDAKDIANTELPYVIVNYNKSLGAIRIDFAGIVKDESGIGYQKSRAINEGGVIRIYRSVSSDPVEELYDIGLSSASVFRVSTSNISDSSWNITVDIKYLENVVESSDLGSTEFSKEAQEIVGVKNADGAKVLSYSFTNSGGVVTMIFNVSGSDSMPIPSAKASLVSDGLQLEFTSLVSDAVLNAVDGKKFGTLTVDSSRSGAKSTYLFKGASKEFKLYGSKSPNQVILEIKL